MAVLRRLTLAVAAELAHRFPAFQVGNDLTGGYLVIKILALSSVAAAALAATPALAQAPAGPRIEVFGGYDKMMNKGRGPFTETVDACADYYCEIPVDSVTYSFPRSKDEAFVFG